MIVLAYQLAANVPEPWSDWMGLIGVIAVVDTAVMLAELPLRAWSTVVSYMGLS
jgi:hypothetical protein